MSKSCTMYYVLCAWMNAEETKYTAVCNYKDVSNFKYDSGLRTYTYVIKIKLLRTFGLDENTGINVGKII